MHDLRLHSHKHLPCENVVLREQRQQPIRLQKRVQYLRGCK